MSIKKPIALAINDGVEAECESVGNVGQNLHRVDKFLFLYSEVNGNR